MLRVGEDRICGTDFDELALVRDGDPVGYLVVNAQIVRDDDNGVLESP